jgi:hypothetical protein
LCRISKYETFFHFFFNNINHFTLIQSFVIIVTQFYICNILLSFSELSTLINRLFTVIFPDCFTVPFLFFFSFPFFLECRSKSGFFHAFFLQFSCPVLWKGLIISGDTLMLLIILVDILN